MFGKTLLLVALVSLSALPARAAPQSEQAPPRAPRATLVEVLRGGKQVLVLDRTTGDYAVMKVGDAIQGFRIAAIEDDQIVLIGGGKPERLFIIPLLDRSPLPPMKEPAAPSLAAPAPAPASASAPPPAAAAPTAPVAPAAPAPAPAAPAPADEDVMDPYGPDEIPADPPPTSAPPAAPAPTPAPTVTAPAPAPTAAPPAAAAAAPAAKPRTEKRKLSRKELNRALADFAALTRDIKIELATGGGILVTELAKGSFPARNGIEKGDVVRRVAGHAIDTVDDAASAYAAVMKAKQVVVEIERRGARLHLTYQLTD